MSVIVEHPSLNEEPLPTASGGRGRRRRRSRPVLVAGAVAVVLAAAAAASVGFGRRTPLSVASPQAATTVQVAREDLVEYATVDGRIDYGMPQPLDAKATGTVTWLAAAGTVVKRGEPLLRADDQPVALLYGTLPMYRDLTAGLKGHDVEQLERNLKALGYDGITVDEEFSAATTSAVKHWQHDLSLPETGTVTPGQVVYAPGALRVAKQSVRVGAALPAAVLDVTGTTKVVTAQVQAGEAGWAVAGAVVTVLAPGAEKGVAGKVQAVGTGGPEAGQASDGGGPSGGGPDGGAIQLTVAVADQKALRALERGSVTVRRTVQEKKGVLTVPVPALLALAEGGYGLEVADSAGTHTVAVQVGMFAGGRVEVSGNGIDAGTTIRMPQ